ncbi:MAG: hypothetical protein SX243_16530 [Acidobacteriota bacterium]|nr:hypothetical protein [Acidobacteriota bacterium]
MDQATERQLMRWLHGELTPAEVAVFERRLEEEPELADRYHRLREVWGGLEPPPEPPVPAGFSHRVMAAVASVESSTASWGALRPQWAAVALVLGLTLGVGAGLTLPETPAVEPPTEEVLEAGIGDTWPWPEPAGSLADEYWRALDEMNGDRAYGGETL